MTYLRAAPLAALLLGTSSLTLAASSLDLTVKGIITPSACAPVVSGGGNVDFGKVSVKDLNADTYTDLPRETMLSVSYTHLRAHET